MHNVDLLVSIPRFFFRNHGCQEDPLNKPVIAGYFFRRLKIKQFQLQSKIECEIVWNLSWINFSCLLQQLEAFWAHDLGSEILGSKNLFRLQFGRRVWLSSSMSLCLWSIKQIQVARWLACNGDPKIRKTLERQSWKTSPIVVCCKMGYRPVFFSRSLGTKIDCQVSCSIWSHFQQTDKLAGCL